MHLLQKCICVSFSDIRYLLSSFYFSKYRIPYLLDVLCAVAIPESGKVSESLIPILASCYSILMKHKYNKYNNLSAFHRLTSDIATDGGLSDRVSLTGTKNCIRLLLPPFPDKLTLREKFYFCFDLSRLSKS